VLSLVLDESHYVLNLDITPANLCRYLKQKVGTFYLSLVDWL
jgi:hypothetical protein